MGLFDNVGNLFDLLLQDDQRPETKTLANRAEVDTSDFSKIAALGLPAILQGINRNNQSDSGLDLFNDALNKHQDVKNYQSMDQLTQNVDPQDGDKILGHVFNDKQSIVDRIAGTLNLSPAAVKRVLALLAPIVLKYLADRKNTNQLDKRGVERETGSLIEQMNSSVRNYGRNMPRQENSGGIFGELFGNDDNKHGRPVDDKNDGILDSILDLFR